MLDLDRKIDFGRTVRDYTKWRGGFPDALFDRLKAWSIGLGGQQIVDLGTGTGTLALNFAKRGARVIAIDRSEPMIDATIARAQEQGLAVDARVAHAEDTGLPSAFADVVIAGQCWHWFDRAAAAWEAKRLLVPGGSLVIAHLDWIELPGNIIEVTDRLIEEANPERPDFFRHFAINGLYGAWLDDVAKAGFRNPETFSFDLDIPYTHAGWRGRIRAHAGIGASLPPQAVEAFDRELGEVLAKRFPEETLSVPHRVFVLGARR